MAGFKINQRAIDQMARELKKGFEQASKRHRIRIPVEADPPGMGTAGGIEEDPVASRALVWLGEQAAEHRGHFHELADFAEQEGLPNEEASGLALALQEHGLVHPLRTFDSSDSIVRLSDEGRLEIRRLSKLAADRVRRANHASAVLLRWLHDQDAAVESGQFVGTETAFYAGVALTEREIADAAAELVADGLAEGDTAPGDTRPAPIRITAAGTSRVRHGHHPRSSMNAQNETHHYYGVTIKGDMTGGSASTGDFTFNTTNGIDPEQLARLVRGLRELAPQLDLDPVDAGDYTAEVDALEQDGLDAEQGPRIWRRIARMMTARFGTSLADGAAQEVLEIASGLYG
ncbi:hypothetical protein GCM10020229_52380 [Kitasatospora albolonga]|uniref:hypothetical protein n=1 Tax=Kitasatospora albolonga TaxID=68173 RepID=UPI0031E61898